MWLIHFIATYEILQIHIFLVRTRLGQIGGDLYTISLYLLVMSRSFWKMLDNSAPSGGPVGPPQRHNIGQGDFRDVSLSLTDAFIVAIIHF